jgi:hypothetical protein
MLLRLADDVLALDPSGVVMLMGTNDLEEGAEPETIAANVKQIIAAIETENPRTPIVVCHVFPSSADKIRPAEQIKKLNALVAEAVKGDPRVRVVDTWTLFADTVGDAKVEEFPDLLHPNEKGYAKWVAAIRPVLETLDLVQLHCPPTDVYYRPEVFEALDGLVKQGKIRFYGVSVEKVEEALKAIEYPGVQSVQIIFNAFRLRPAELFFEQAARRQVAVIARVPLASG